MSIDELIKRLEFVRSVDGNVDVVLPSDIGWVRSIRSTTIAIVGKADATKLVSRGGVPVLVLRG